MVSIDKGEQRPRVVVLEPDLATRSLLARIWQRSLKDIENDVWMSFAEAGERISDLENAEVLVLPVGKEAQGLELVIVAIATFPNLVVVFYTGGAMIPKLCITRADKTFFLQRPASSDAFVQMIRDAVACAQKLKQGLE